MLFSSTIFLFAFLPLVLALHFLLRTSQQRNVLLLIASLVFYAWGETSFVLMLLASIGVNFGFGLWIDRAAGKRAARGILALGVSLNLLALAVFKYASFAADNLDAFAAVLGFEPIALAPVHLPIGISFFTFQALTYLVDVYRRDAVVERSPLQVGLYIALFPQLIAGPIVRYREIASELRQRSAALSDIAAGIRRFIVGLGKKVLVANTLAGPADAVFASDPSALGAATAWIGVVCFAFQIYFDFSGYSDMAIGLGRIFGFHFPENFDQPYRSRSLREFWRRWHITLSTWFRDYLYIPLGGNRRSAGRTHANLVTVFLLCGLWHGPSWNFVIWGLVHGAFLVLERTALGGWLARAPALLQHVYALAVVLFAWVFFRAETLPQALATLGAMVGLGAAPTAASAPTTAELLGADVALALALAALVSIGFRTELGRQQGDFVRRLAARAPAAHATLRFSLLMLVLLGSAMSIAGGTHEPFIYFRF